MMLTAYAAELDLYYYADLGHFYPFIIRFVIVLAATIVVLFLWMMIMYAITERRYRKVELFKSRLKEFIDKTVDNPDYKVAQSLQSLDYLLGRDNISALNELFLSLDTEEKDALKAILSRSDCETYVSDKLDEDDNEEYLIDLMRVVGEFNLVHLSDKIVSIIMSNKRNISIVFEALLTLAHMGSTDSFLKICLDKDYIQHMSFRNLQEIIATYTGNREELFHKLLSAPDDYVIRICIKSIGSEGISALVPEILQYLDSPNINLVIDTLRTIGALKYKSVLERVQKLLGNERWEVRNAVVQTIAAIDADNNIEFLVKALQDKEWFVRYNAGQALCGTSNLEKVRDMVRATNDRFANDMLEYMTTTKDIRGAV